MLTDFHGRANQNFALWEQRISSKPWALSVVPHFSLSPPRVTFSRVGRFSRALAFRTLYYPWGKRGTTPSLQVTTSCSLVSLAFPSAVKHVVVCLLPFRFLRQQKCYWDLLCSANLSAVKWAQSFPKKNGEAKWLSTQTRNRQFPLHLKTSC